MSVCERVCLGQGAGRAFISICGTLLCVEFIFLAFNSIRPMSPHRGRRAGLSVRQHCGCELGEKSWCSAIHQARVMVTATLTSRFSHTLLADVTLPSTKVTTAIPVADDFQDPKLHLSIRMFSSMNDKLKNDIK